MKPLNPRIAYFTHTFPGYTSTFIVEEIGAMRDLGADLRLFSAHIPKGSEVPSSFKAFADETKSIFPINSRILILEHARAVWDHPTKYVKSLWLALTADRQLSRRDRGRTLLHWLQAPILQRLCHENGVEHVHVHFLNSPASVTLFAHLIYGTPYSITAHGSDIFVEKILQKEKISHARFTRVMTRFNFDALEKMGSPAEELGQKLCLIPIGVEMSPKSERSPGREIFRFLHVGRMVWQKGQRMLLEACQRLKDAGHVFELVFVGDGELRNDVSRWVTELDLEDRVRLLGAVPKAKIIDLYRTCDCFVLSSLSEGSPAVLVEAMSEGLPVIAPALHGIPEMFDNGRDGWLFETGNLASLTAAMTDAMNDPERLQGMGAAALQHARTQFDLLENTRRFHSKLMDCFFEGEGTARS